MENTRNAKCILTDNAIPTSCGNLNNPVFIMGENAYYVKENELENGAMIDVSAAKILTERGIDVGLIEAEKYNFAGEYYVKKTIPYLILEVWSFSN